ncbi:dATP/dGTP pyrophosphohydrolase domain-containing protein [Dyella sp. 2RAB6]|uniref:dATP/dGTP pyrophosphohydrolase domain-containing protein n=1 Tax=Dyella sp. 2RAB6 TaxID=3232992 RepID=UPI003F900E25
MSNSTPLCIYHGNCTDGFAAAWAVRCAQPGADFVAASYGSTPPDVTGRIVYIVDFSYSRDVLLAMAEKATQIVVLDHHKTAAEQLGDLPQNVIATFDMERSGCMLAWQHFFGHELPPQLLLHIQDRDLWTWKLPHTKEILAAVFSYPHDFEVWDRLMWGPIDDLRNEGVALQRKHDKDIESLLPSARLTDIGGHLVPTINLPPMMASEAGAALAKDQPFAAIYWDTRSGRQYSLRSAPDGVDVAAIAQQFGGGGHKHAAGFKAPWGHPLTLPTPADQRPGYINTQTAERRLAELLTKGLGRQHEALTDLGTLIFARLERDQLIEKKLLHDFVTDAPAFDFAAHLLRQRYFSERTFGPGYRAKGVVAHIRKELNEIESAPADLTEWIDVAILALDGAWRSGATPQQIIDALVAKQAKNEGRAWPDWRTMDPDSAIEHDRSGEASPADVAPGCALVTMSVGMEPGRWEGWIFAKHADGQWVSVAKLQPFGLALMRAAAAQVHEGTAA